MAKKLYMCQADCGLFAFTYAENMNDAKLYLDELMQMYLPTWGEHELRFWGAENGWVLAPTDENYHEIGEQAYCDEGDPLSGRIARIPFSISTAEEKLKGLLERRANKKAKEAGEPAPGEQSLEELMIGEKLRRMKMLGEI